MSTMQARTGAKVDTFIIGAGTQPVAESRVRTTERVYSDLHPGVFRTLLATWAAFMSLFWIVFAPSAYTVYLLTVISLYAVAFFGLPILMNRVGHFVETQSGTLSDFLNGSVETIDGRVSGWEALIQVILVPACLTVGGVFIAYIIVVARAAAIN